MDPQTVLQLEYWNNSVSAYLTALGVLVGAVVVAWIIKKLSTSWLKRWAEKTATKADDIILELINWPLYGLLVILGAYQATMMLNIPERGHVVAHHAMVLASALVIVLTASRLLHIIFENYATELAAKTESRMDDQILPVLRRGLKGVLWILAVLLVIDNFGFDVMALITGLGLGGLAVAMAAKDTLSNMLGGITIFIDQPFKIDDVVKLSGYLGKVEEVGLRTTRIRTFDGHVVTIPNASAANGNIENISERPSIRVRFNLGLTYDTPMEKCREAVDRVVEAINGVEGIIDGTALHFVDFSDSSIDFQLTYFIDLEASFFDVKHEVNLAIKETLGEGDISMAFPTVTIDAPEDLFTGKKAA